MSLGNVNETATLIRNNIEKVIVGKADLIDLTLTALLGGGHILLEDVPGTGKTMIAKSLSKSFEANFKRIQFTPDLLPSDITGLNFYNQKEGEFTFRPGPVFTNILLADEINRGTPRTQSSLLECMEEKQITIDGETRILEKPFLVIATQNPVETAGTFPLPEAQLDRFMMKLYPGLPSTEEEVRILQRFISNNPLDQLTPVCNREDFLNMQSTISSVYIHPSLLEYIVAIVSKTRNEDSLLLGVSPRGTQALLKACQAYAAIKGRDYVLPEDIKYLALPVLAHRLVLRSPSQGSHATMKLLGEFISQVPVPTENFNKR